MAFYGDVPGDKLVPSWASQATVSGREHGLLRGSQTFLLFLRRREGPKARHSGFWLDFGSLQGDGAGRLL